MKRLFQFINLNCKGFALFCRKVQTACFSTILAHFQKVFGQFGIRRKRALFLHLSTKLVQTNPCSNNNLLGNQDENKSSFFRRYSHVDSIFQQRKGENAKQSWDIFHNKFAMQNDIIYFCIYETKKPCHRARTARRTVSKSISVHFLNHDKFMKNSTIETKNVFQEAHSEFLNSTLHQRLEQKFKVEPFYKRYRTLKNVLSVSSYGLNLFSAATAFTCVFVFINTLLQNTVLASLFSIGFLMLLEILKRLTIPDFIKNYLQFGRINALKIIFILGLTATSVALSYLGAKDSVEIFTPSVQLLSIDSVKSSYTPRITALEDRLKEVKKTQSWRGKLTPAGQKTYNQVSAQIAVIEDDMLKNTNRVTDKNDGLQAYHNSKTAVNAHYFGLFTLGLDLLLIAFLFFGEYYDYRSLTEFTQKSPPQNKTSEDDDVATSSQNTENVVTDLAYEADFTDNAVSTDLNHHDKGILQLAIKNAKSNLAAYEAKLRNREGNEDTVQRGIERWKNKVVELEFLHKMAVS